jgi:hypothetical protein
MAAAGAEEAIPLVARLAVRVAVVLVAAQQTAQERLELQILAVAVAVRLAVQHQVELAVLAVRVL